MGLLLRDHVAADRDDGGDDAVDPLGALVLGRFEVAGGLPGSVNIGRVMPYEPVDFDRSSFRPHFSRFSDA